MIPQMLMFGLAGQAGDLLTGGLWLPAATQFALTLPQSGLDDAILGTTSGFSNSNAENKILYTTIGTDRIKTFLRYRISAPRGSRINSAFIQFTPSRTSSANTMAAQITQYDIDDADPMASSPPTGNQLLFNIKTWDIPQWTLDVADETAKTPEIKDLIQSFVERSGYSPGNYILLGFDYPTSTTAKSRYSHSYDGDPSLAAVLHLSYDGPVIYRQPVRIGPNAYRISWDSPNYPNGPFWVWVNGRLVGQTASRSYVVTVNAGESVFVDVFVAALDRPPTYYPDRIVIQWPGNSSALRYVVEQFVSGQWTQRGSIPESGRAYYSWQSGVLADVTTHSFRVKVVGSNGVSSSYATHSTMMVRVPDSPLPSWSYDDQSQEVTIASV